MASPQLLPGVCLMIGNGISLSRPKVTLKSGDTLKVYFARKGYITAQSPTETAKPRIAFPHPDKTTYQELANHQFARFNGSSEITRAQRKPG